MEERDYLAENAAYLKKDLGKINMISGNELCVPEGEASLLLWRQLRFHITENLIGRRAEHITFFRFVFRELLADGGDGFLLWGSSAIPRSVKNEDHEQVQ